MKVGCRLVELRPNQVILEKWVLTVVELQTNRKKMMLRKSHNHLDLLMQDKDVVTVAIIHSRVSAPSAETGSTTKPGRSRYRNGNWQTLVRGERGFPSSQSSQVDQSLTFSKYEEKKIRKLARLSK